MDFIKCSEITVDWFYTTEVGEEYIKYMVGQNDVSEILYHESKFEGDKHYCDIVFTNGKRIREFNVSYLEFMK